MQVNQTAELRYPATYSRESIERVIATVLEQSPGLTAEVHVLGWPASLTSVVFSGDYPRPVDWRRHREVVSLAVRVAGEAHRFESLR